MLVAHSAFLALLSLQGLVGFYSLEGLPAFSPEILHKPSALEEGSLTTAEPAVAACSLPCRSHGRFMGGVRGVLRERKEKICCELGCKVKL